MVSKDGQCEIVKHEEVEHKSHHRVGCEGVLRVFQQQTAVLGLQESLATLFLFLQ